MRDWRAARPRRARRCRPAAATLVDTLRATLAYILINRDGAGDPARLAHLRALVDPRRRAHVRRRCCRWATPRRCASFLALVRAATSSPTARSRAASTAAAPIPVPEHDSNGEFIYAVAEYYRYTRDVGFVQRTVADVIARRRDWIALRARRARRRRIASRAGGRSTACCPSRSATRATRAHPVHSYWDDFFALRGLTDAAELAPCARRRRARPRASPRCATTFRADLVASIARAWRRDGIDYLPGSAELGDFDPTSTTIALDARRSSRDLPRGGARAHLRALLGERRASAATARRLGRPTRPTSCATSTRSCASASASAPTSCSTCFLARPAARRRGTSGPRSSGATRARRTSSATCRTPGSASGFVRAVLDHARLRARGRPRARARRRRPARRGSTGRRAGRRSAACARPGDGLAPARAHGDGGCSRRSTASSALPPAASRFRQPLRRLAGPLGGARLARRRRTTVDRPARSARSCCRTAEREIDTEDAQTTTPAPPRPLRSLLRRRHASTW